MMTKYDMNTGKIIESRQLESTTTDSVAAGADFLQELKLHEVIYSCNSREERLIPPELAIADLNAFLNDMS